VADHEDDNNEETILGTVPYRMNDGLSVMDVDGKWLLSQYIAMACAT